MAGRPIFGPPRLCRAYAPFTPRLRPPRAFLRHVAGRLPTVNLIQGAFHGPDLVAAVCVFMLCHRRPADGVRPLVGAAFAQQTLTREPAMYGMYWLGGAVALGLFVYLVIALVRAEDF